MLKIIRWFGLGLVLIVLAACQPADGVKTYRQVDFSFAYPARWQTMNELWPKYQAGKEYYQLGVTEILQVTSVQKQGQSGGYFASASRTLAPGETLEMACDQAYQPFGDQLRDFSKTEVDLNGKKGFAFRYSRPWGEPYLSFQDYWVEVGGTVYLFSFHALRLDPYQSEMDKIFASITFDD